MLENLLEWSQNHFSGLPWREGRNPYRTLVSEIMLQQTTVGTVLKHYQRFLDTFPDISSLSKASTQEVIKAWEGLGYYRRARNLHAAANEIMSQHKGIVPSSYKKLTLIKGIGDYTASAVLSLCFGEKMLAFDANVERVLSRFFRSTLDKGPKNILSLKEIGSKEFKDCTDFGALNEALMDIGRNFCTARKAHCETCCLNTQCKSAFKVDATTFPKVKEKKKANKNLDLKVLRVIKRKEDKVLFFKRPKGKWLEGQYELPSFQLSCVDKKLNQYPLAKEIDLSHSSILKSSITKYKIENYILDDRVGKFNFTSKGRWISKLDKSAHITTISKKILDW